jgi:hypothetical protein
MSVGGHAQHRLSTLTVLAVLVCFVLEPAVQSPDEGVDVKLFSNYHMEWLARSLSAASALSPFTGTGTVSCTYMYSLY